MRLVILIVFCTFFLFMGNCGTTSDKGEVNVPLSASDTIVTLGQYRVQIPRKAPCLYRFFENDTTTASVLFFDCGSGSSLMEISATVIWAIDELDAKAHSELDAQLQWNRMVECERSIARQGVQGNKHWQLCEGFNLYRTSSIYVLHIIIEEKRFYGIVRYIISPTYYKELARSGEIERIVGAIRIWPQ